MSHSHAEASMPRPVLYGAAALVAFALTMAAAARLSTPDPSQAQQAATTLMQRDLRFEDRSDGGVNVIDAGSKRVIEIVAPGTNGFLRGALRGMARQRRLQGLGSEAPFRLMARSDGSLQLEDLATRRHIDLSSFGPTNSGAFAKLLTLRDPST
jgi:putative photosynthetic complex assembly protein